MADTLTDRQSFDLNRYLINTYIHTHISHRSIVIEGPVRISLAFSSMCCCCAHGAYTRCLLLACKLHWHRWQLHCLLCGARFRSARSLSVTPICLSVCLPAYQSVCSSVRSSLPWNSFNGGTFSFQLTVVTALKRLLPHLASQCCCAFRRGQALLYSLIYYLCN